MMKVGDRVVIHSTEVGACEGEIMALDSPETMPVVTTKELADAARRILTGWGVSRIALIGYAPVPRSKDRLIFAAVEIDGLWYDMKRKNITLTPIAPEAVQ